MSRAGYKYILKTLLDVYLLRSNFANLILGEDTATGTSTFDVYPTPRI